MNLELLKTPFPTYMIKWRISHVNESNSTAMVLAYIDARHVQDRLDDVCGAGNWQVRHPREGYCEIGININTGIPYLKDRDSTKEIEYQYITPEWVWKGNGADKTKVEAVKGQYSDAEKRAAVEWGVGRYLYGLPTQWTDVIKRGKSWVIKDLKALTLPDWADPNKAVYIERSVKNKVIEQSIEFIETADEEGLKQLWSEFDQEEHGVLWYLFSSQQRSAMKKLMRGE